MNRRWAPALGSLALVLAFCGGARDRVAPAAAPSPPSQRPTANGQPPAPAPVVPEIVTPQLSEIDSAVNAALAANKLPGAVVVVGRHDSVLFRRAYGSKSIVPARTPMTLDTVFDLASLTKPVATATSIMVLVERGQVGLDEPVAKYIAEFNRPGKSTITIRQVMTHVSGLPVEMPTSVCAGPRDALVRRIADAPLRAAPGEQFIYSDTGFIVLEEIVRRVSGTDLAAFSRDAIFTPLGMKETGFKPPETLRARCAPTEPRPDGTFLQGDVHDPRAQAMGGVAGHAGVFSTADDMTKFAQAMLAHGRGVMQPATWMQLVARHDVPGGIRALGWDVKSSYSGNRGEGMSLRAIGHGGYTGTGLWIDPENDLFVLFLSNRVHPDGKGSVNPLIGQIGTIATKAITTPAIDPTLPPATWCTGPGHVETGIDVLRAESFARLKGARIGLVTNVSGKGSDGTSTVDALLHAPASSGVQLVALFTPEHGLGADREGKIASATDERTGLPIHSLYGPNAFAPTSDSLLAIDTMVFDVQDVGVRFYTYASTMRRAMEAATARGLRFVVLDRPNPIGGTDVAGPVLSPSAVSGFVNHHPLPVRHGMTIGELAQLFDADLHMGALLEIVKMRGWRRGDYFDETGLPWVNPSPNLRSVDEEVFYPGVGLVEGTNVSVGRGTDMPFEVVGAPWIEAPKLAAALSSMGLAGVTFAPITFTPKSTVYATQSCGGVRLTITSRAQFEPVRTGIAIAMQLRALYPTEWKFDDLMKLIADRRILDAIDQKKSLPEIESLWAADLAAFKAKREKYLLYSSTASGCP